jgi:hypothetical protein
MAMVNLGVVGQTPGARAGKKIRGEAVASRAGIGLTC